MCNPLDPTVLHGAECVTCGAYFADGDELNADGECDDCVAELEELEREESFEEPCPLPRLCEESAKGIPPGIYDAMIDHRNCLVIIGETGKKKQ